MSAAMEALIAREAEYEKRKTPVRVTLEEWEDSLNVLPPTHWWTVGGAETFTVPEPMTDRLYSRYMRIGDDRWVMLADIRDSPAELVKRIRKVEQRELEAIAAAHDTTPCPAVGAEEVARRLAGGGS